MEINGGQLEESVLLCPPGFVQADANGSLVYMREDVSVEQLQMLLTHDADVLKETAKVQVRAVGHWVIKERKTDLARALVAPSRNRSRHRCGWLAGNYLRARGVRVPEPLAYLERGTAGVVIQSWHIFQNLQRFRDVETYLSEVIYNGANGPVLAAFLHNLAAELNRLEAAGAYHSDLSGKNIYTRDGLRFYLIDLDAVEYGVPYNDEKRLRNHVQLYDSFCDALPDSFLVPFIGELLTQSHDLRVWMPKVRKVQEQRRAKVEEDWAKHGQPERINPLRAFRPHS